jgi:hypothetical protein
MAQTTSELLDLYSNAALLSMTKARGVYAKQMRKAEMLAALSQVLEDEESARRAFESLAAPAKVMLRLLREAGGASTLLGLKTAANRAGISNFDEHLHDLMRQSLVLFSTIGNVRHELWRNPNSVSYGWRASLDYKLVGVQAAMALAGDEVELPPPAHSLRAFEGEPHSVHEESPAALLHAVFTVARWAGERDIVLAKTTGAPKKTDLRALQAQLKGKPEWSDFVLALALGAGLLRQARGKIEAAPDAPAFFTLPPREQVARLYEAWLSLRTWSEFFRIPQIETDSQTIPSAAQSTYGYSDVPTAQALPPARAFVMGVLRRSGSATVGQWQSLASLLQVAEAEEPEFLIPRGRNRYHYGGAREDSYYGIWERGGSRWSSKLSRDEDWAKVEGGFIRQMLCEPLLWLGLVATAQDGKGEVVAFRLTPLGAQVLGLASALEEAREGEAGERPLIVQPNFEIIAYTEARHLTILYELERFADRVSAERVAHYALSRESVYRGLKDGLSAPEMRQFLERHSRSGLPQNIAYSLGDWQEQFERVTLRRSASVIEADSADELDALLGTLPAEAATRLAPCWAVIEPKYLQDARSALAARKDARALDYALPVAQAFHVTEDLQVVVPVENLDLWLRSRLEQFADALPSSDGESDGATRFQISRSSLARAAEMRLKHDEVLAFLEEVGTPPLPADVSLTVRGWGDALAPAFLGAASVLVAEAGLVEQLAAVESLRSLLWLRADDRVALVRDEDVPRLRAELEKRGLLADATPSAHLRPPRRPKAEATPPRSRPAHRAVSITSGVGQKIRPAVVSRAPLGRRCRSGSRAIARASAREAGERHPRIALRGDPLPEQGAAGDAQGEPSGSRLRHGPRLPAGVGSLAPGLPRVPHRPHPRAGCARREV